MFFLIGLIIVLIGLVPLYRTIRRRKTFSTDEYQKRTIRSLLIGLATLIGVVLIGVFFHFYTEFLWFGNLGFGDRYWLEIIYSISLFLGGAGFAFIFVFLNLRIAFAKTEFSAKTLVSLVISLVIAILIGIWTSGLWQTFLAFLNQAQSEITDPIFGNSISFYLFTLPFLKALTGYFIILLILTAALVAGTKLFAISFGSGIQAAKDMLNKKKAIQSVKDFTQQLMVLAGLLFFVFAFATWLSRFDLLRSSAGVVHGIGWTDANIRLPALIIISAVWALAGLLLIAAAFNAAISRKILGIEKAEVSSTSIESEEANTGKATTKGPSLTKRAWIVPGIIAGIILLGTWIVPSSVEALFVEPSQISLEMPYLEHNIRLTRQAYGIDEQHVQEQEFSVGRDISQEVIANNMPTIENIRLWDWRALMANLEQQQEIRLYYQFHDVDIDRYTVNDEYRQMMLSVRELELSELDPSSQTWISRHFKYTHGYGLVILPAHDILPEGRPNLLIRNIPPEVRSEDLNITRPEIYFGERTNSHVYVNTSQEEFDYPLEDENAYTTYQGEGGVALNSALRRIAYASQIDGYRQLFSGYFTPESRIMFRRNITRRAQAIAPFLRYDRDPYPVLTEEGRIKYIIDAYTLTSGFPYSQPYTGRIRQFAGANYIRNSVKVVVNAYDGTLDFYIVDEDDPIIQTYSNIFPDLFHSFDDMPQSIEDHIRYPEGLLTVQSNLYRTYHMTDPQVFYQREDVWQYATERYRENFQRVSPYYIMVQLPESDQAEFVLMVPFTPQNKNVMNAWMAGRCDQPNYGQLVVYTFPKGTEVLGPRQIEARIDQNTEMSRALSLWSQRGSEVIRGNLLSVPLFSNGDLYIMFAEPVFLQAQETELPEIKRVALADQDDIVWADTFEGSLNILLGRSAMEEPAAAGTGVSPDSQELINQAVDAFNRYTENLRNEEFGAAGEALDELRSVMQDIEGQLE
ncbi:MAG: UPF0182 family protein [Spirochaetia bacterium]